MAILEEYFGYNTISLYTGVFGSVFDEIKIKRADGKLIKVPIRYELNQKYAVRDEENPDPDKARYKSQLPRMSFRLVGLERDQERVTDRLKTIVSKPVDMSGITAINSQLQRVPYSYRFKLSIKTKNIIDMNQILEQILPYFNPSLCVIVKDNEYLGKETNINIKLLSSASDEVMSGAFEDETVIESEMDFEMDGWLYMPQQTSKIITKVNVNFYEDFEKSIIDSITEVP